MWNNSNQYHVTVMLILPDSWLPRTVPRWIYHICSIPIPRNKTKPTDPTNGSSQIQDQEFFEREDEIINHLLWKFSRTTRFSADVPADRQVVSGQATAWSVAIDNAWKSGIWNLASVWMQISMYVNRAGLLFRSFLSFLVFLSQLSTLATHFAPAGKNTADATRHQLSPPPQGEDEPVMHITFPRLNLCLGSQQSL